MAVKPRIGLDLRIISTVSLSFAYDFSFGLWGHQRADVRFLDHPLTGQICHYQADNIRSAFTLGVKVDFPTKPISDTAVNNLFMILSSWIGSKAYH